MRYTAFLILGILLIVLQAQIPLFFGALTIYGFEPSLLTTLLVFLGVAEQPLGLLAGIAFVLGYTLDIVGGAPLGIYSLTSVTTLVVARATGVRIVIQGGLLRALLAGAFAGLQTMLVAVLLAIFGRNPYVPGQIMRHVPGAAALTAPLVYWLAERVQGWVTALLEGPKTDTIKEKKKGSRR
jgi:rod shape-determining protein MreD